MPGTAPGRKPKSPSPRTPVVTGKGTKRPTRVGDLPRPAPKRPFGRGVPVNPSFRRHGMKGDDGD